MAITKFTCWDVLSFLSMQTKKLVWKFLYFQAFPRHGIDMLFAVATYISSMFSFPSYHFMYEFGIHLHYAFLTTDTNFYHFIFNVCTGTLAMEFLILEIKVLTDFMAGVMSVDWSLCF